jgi:tripartite-type tricarboxylate transporter receptor subunit TctC
MLQLHRMFRRHLHQYSAIGADIRAGKLPALAVTSATRSVALPDVPAVGDFLRVTMGARFLGSTLPKIRSPKLSTKLNSEINVGLADLKIKGRLADIGGAPMSMTPAEFGELVADETEKWGKVIRAANIKPEYSRLSPPKRYRFGCGKSINPL